MKLTFSPASPFARKVRIAAIELGLIDKIEFTPASVAPGTANEDYSKITPLRQPSACMVTRMSARKRTGSGMCQRYRPKRCCER